MQHRTVDVTLTAGRKRLLRLLSDGKWHTDFTGIGTRTFEQMRRFRFIRTRYVHKRPDLADDYTIEAQITESGKKLLRRARCMIRLVPVRGWAHPRVVADFSYA